MSDLLAFVAYLAAAGALLFLGSAIARASGREAPTPLSVPPDSECECSCLGRDHWLLWKGSTFIGTRCEAHGGHKFAFRRI